MDWDDVVNHLKEILALLIIGGSWVFGLFYRAFMQKKRRQRPPGAPPQQQQGQQPPARPAQPRPAGAQDPMNPRDEVQNFLENLRRQAENAARQQQESADRPLIVEAEEDDWIPLDDLEEEPRHQPPRPVPAHIPVQRPRPSLVPTFPESDSAAPVVEQAPTQSTNTSGFYSPPGKLHLPNWMTLQEMANVSRSDFILGMPVRDAILINEILAPPRALRPLRPGTGARSPQS